MLIRIANDRGSGNDFFDFKTGIGGMIEAEFLVQALQMQQSVWEPNSLQAIEQLCAPWRPSNRAMPTSLRRGL